MKSAKKTKQTGDKALHTVRGLRLAFNPTVLARLYRLSLSVISTIFNGPYAARVFMSYFSTTESTVLRSTLRDST